MEIDTSFLQYNYPCNLEEEKHKKRKNIGSESGNEPGTAKMGCSLNQKGNTVVIICLLTIKLYSKKYDLLEGNSVFL